MKHFRFKGILAIFLFAFAFLSLQSCGSSRTESKIASIRERSENSSLPEKVKVIFAKIPESCFRFSPFCPFGPDLELALETEFWGHVHNADFESTRNWIKKAKQYTDSAMYPPARNKKRARLYMLLASANIMIFNSYDLENVAATVDPALKLDLKRFLSRPLDVSLAKNVPAIGFLLESLWYATKAMDPKTGIPEHQNAAAFLYSTKAFVQLALPNLQPLGVGFDAALDTVYGQSLMPDWEGCTDKDSCARRGAGTEGVFSGTLLLGFVSDERTIRDALRIFGDGPGENDIALCESYACQFTNPRLPEDPKSSIAPFKRIMGLMSIAEMYAKIGEKKKMMAALAEAERESVRLQWPFGRELEKLKKALLDESPGSLVERWGSSKPATLGKVLMPLPPSAGAKTCQTCHFGGRMPGKEVYH